MKQEDKELLLRDLCGRLPYGVKYSCTDIKNTYRLKSIFTRSDNSIFCDGCNDLELCRPYLFPLSSMTEKQKEFLRQQNWCIAISTSGTIETTIEGFDWLNENHFDYRGLIPMDLAIDATGLNIY